MPNDLSHGSTPAKPSRDAAAHHKMLPPVPVCSGTQNHSRAYCSQDPCRCGHSQHDPSLTSADIAAHVHVRTEWIRCSPLPQVCASDRSPRCQIWAYKFQLVEFSSLPTTPSHSRSSQNLAKQSVPCRFTWQTSLLLCRTLNRCMYERPSNILQEL